MVLLLVCKQLLGSDAKGCMTMQVAINWTICKGAVPIPGAKNARQAKEAAGWSTAHAAGR